MVKTRTHLTDALLVSLVVVLAIAAATIAAGALCAYSGLHRTAAQLFLGGAILLAAVLLPVLIYGAVVARRLTR